MTIRLVIEPGVTYTKEEFIRLKGPYSIALDGIIRHEKNFTINPEDGGPIINIDHHHPDLDRSKFPCTSRQALEDVEEGLYELFSKDGKPHATIYVNDADQDVGLATYILMHPELAKETHPNLEKLVALEDKLDRKAGMVLKVDKQDFAQVSWVFEPYTTERFSKQGLVWNQHSEESRSAMTQKMENIIYDTHKRIDAYRKGLMKETDIETGYVTLFKSKNWSLVYEKGIGSRLQMAKDGIKSAISLKQRRPDGNYDYVYLSLGKNGFGEKVPQVMNAAEAEFFKVQNKEVDPGNLWDGTDVVGGSGRLYGSPFGPKELVEFVNQGIYKIPMGQTDFRYYRQNLSRVLLDRIKQIF